MNPTTTYYNGLDMPTSGMTCQPDTTCTGTTGVLFTWVSSTASNGGFSQNGIIWNGGSGSLCSPGPCPPGHTIPPQSWGMFYTYCFVCSGSSAQYYGDVVNPPSGWSMADHIYYTEAVYPSKGEFAYQFTDVSCFFCGSTVNVWVCYTQLNSQFTGVVGGINEGGSGTYKYISVTSIDLFAQVSSNNQRNYGSGHAYDSGSPSSDQIRVSGTNQFQLGFGNVAGQHYSNGYQLWSGSGTGGLEHFPPDKC